MVGKVGELLARSVQFCVERRRLSERGVSDIGRLLPSLAEVGSERISREGAAASICNIASVTSNLLIWSLSRL